MKKAKVRVLGIALLLFLVLGQVACGSISHEIQEGDYRLSFGSENQSFLGWVEC